MSIHDSLFPSHAGADPRGESSITGSTDPVRNGAPEHLALRPLLPSTELPEGFCFQYSIRWASDRDPVTVALAPEPFGRLVFAILHEAAELAIGPSEECALTTQWVEKQNWTACGQAWPFPEPAQWRLQGRFRQKITLLEHGKLPRTVIAAVQSVFAEGFAGMDGLTAERRAMANSFLPATSVPIIDSASTVRAAFPIRDEHKEGFAAIINNAASENAVPAFFPCPFATLQRMAEWICENLVIYGNRDTMKELSEELGYLACGELVEDFQFVLLGLISLAASECTVGCEQRREYIRSGSPFREAIIVARDVGQF